MIVLCKVFGRYVVHMTQIGHVLVHLSVKLNKKSLPIIREALLSTLINVKSQ